MHQIQKKGDLIVKTITNAKSITGVLLCSVILTANAWSQNMISNNSASGFSGAYTLNGGTATLTDQTITASEENESGVYVLNSGVLTMTNSSITTSGATSDGDSSSFYGLNAGVLASSGGQITLSGSTVTTSGEGANGVFAYGTASITLANDTIYCTGRLGHAIMASGGGTLTATDVVMTTTNTNSGAIATDRGSGTITVNGGKVLTTGKDSPGIYSTGIITVSDAEVTATGSEAVVIEGLNTTSLTNVTLYGGISTYGGVLVVQTMSGDSETGTAEFNMTGGSFEVPLGPVFFVTNTDAVLSLTNVDLTATSGDIVYAQGTDRWGTSGSNGGIVTFNASQQTLTGNFVVDDISTLAITLEDNSTLTGAINNACTAKADTITIDATSKWTATANSYLTKIVTADNSTATLTNYIDAGSGIKIYYNSAANSWLGGGTYSLTSGGYLLPEGSDGVDNQTVCLPTEASLQQNFPNPFNPTTTIGYHLPAEGFVSLKVFDMLGREVVTLVNGKQYTGTYTATFNGTNLASGFYFYQLRTANQVITKKMLLTK